jgi:lactate dehydrogenase-like 2-hydroxyacid dehydrogenase
MRGAKVLITGSGIRPDLLAPLHAAGLVIEQPDRTLSEAELANALAGAAAYIKGGAETVTEAVLARATGLKVIAFNGMGYESSIDVDAARARGVAITIAHDTLNNAMADLALGLILASIRRIHLIASQLERGAAPDAEKRRDLAALKVGVIGMGGSGARIAEVLREGFRAPVSYYSRTRKPELETRLGLAYRELDALIGESDVLVVIVAANAATWGLIDNARIARAKSGQVLINVARPAIVDADALLWGLTEGPLSYAAYDGFYKEPAALVAQLTALAPQKLMVTSHIGSLTHDARDAMAAKAVRSLLNILERGEDADRVV